MLKLVPDSKEAIIVRTLDMDIPNKCQVEVDVGGMYESRRDIDTTIT
jgi:uncharacterized UPF0160 family protein